MRSPRSILETTRAVYVASAALVMGFGLTVIGLSGGGDPGSPAFGGVGAACPLPAAGPPEEVSVSAAAYEPDPAPGEISASHLETAVFAVG